MADIGRIKRQYFGHFINVTPGETTSVYERLGIGNDTLSRTKNMNVEKSQDVTGSNEISITRGDEEVSITPYVARKGTQLFELLMGLDDNDAELDELITDYVEVKMWEEEGAVLNTATRRKAYIEITEVGGDTTGFQLPFNLHLSGAKEKGKWNPETKTFTPNTTGTDTMEDETFSPMSFMSKTTKNNKEI